MCIYARHQGCYWERSWISKTKLRTANWHSEHGERKVTEQPSYGEKIFWHATVFLKPHFLVPPDRILPLMACWSHTRSDRIPWIPNQFPLTFPLSNVTREDLKFKIEHNLRRFQFMSVYRELRCLTTMDLMANLSLTTKVSLEISLRTVFAYKAARANSTSTSVYTRGMEICTLKSSLLQSRLSVLVCTVKGLT